MDIPKATQDKGQKLVDDGKVTRVRGTAFVVLGSTGTPYSVWLADPDRGFGQCECPSTARVCPHIFAAAVYHQANPEPVTAKKFRDAFEGLT